MGPPARASRGAYLRSLAAELGGVAVAGLVLGAVLAAGAVAVVYRRLTSTCCTRPPRCSTSPRPAVAATVLVTVVVAGPAALHAQRAADRADPASVLRGDA
ncbi:MAG: rane protein of unknown function [Modestobacter sp.]|nr:rane protein of unknown function [Modestobacter sp.]